MTHPSFRLNGRTVALDAADPDESLLRWLKRQRLHGTKEGCADGDCGACTVAWVETEADGIAHYRAVNSCLLPMGAVVGREVLTVEGLARDGQLHPAQQAMVDCAGSQCGYCTPGFVMSLFVAQQGGERGDAVFEGNLCRCTGYLPIRAATARLPALAADDHFAAGLARSASPAAATLGHWSSPTTIEDALRLKVEQPDAAWVGGATDLGVELSHGKAVAPRFIALDRIAGLDRIEIGTDAVVIGAGTRLARIERELAGVFPALDQMLPWFAARQVRNRATLGGNLGTASPIGDLLPVLLALDASVHMRGPQGARDVPIEAYFLDYRKTARAADELILAVSIPKRASVRQAAYKVAKRQTDDISIVAACFALGLAADGSVDHVRLAFGGVAAIPKRARAVEEYLRGRRLDDATIDEARARLSAAFTPLDDHRGSAEYRRALCGALFAKFVRESGNRERGTGDPEGAARVPSVIASRSTSSQFPSNPDLPRPPTHDDAPGHVTGRATYTDEQHPPLGELCLYPVQAPHAHARILAIDATQARAMPGVHAVLTAHEVPGENDTGPILHDEPLIPAALVEFHGQAVAWVVAEDEAAAQAAARRVEVSYEPLPARTTLREAIAQECFHLPPARVVRGDAAAALAAAPHRLEGEIEIGGQDHFYLETQASRVHIDGDGIVHVCASTQHPTETQLIVARVLGLPANRVVCRSLRMGGGFGGKETQANPYAAVAALAAWRTGRPVRIKLSRALDMQLTGKRHPFLARYRVGFDGEGVLHAMQIELFADGGWSCDLSPPVLMRAMVHVDNAYYCPNVAISGRIGKTHLASNTAFRGFGGPQGMVVGEEILDRVSRYLGLSPHEVRERNFYRADDGPERNTTPYGQPVVDNHLPELWAQLRRDSDFDARRAQVDAFNAASTTHKRGLAITPVKFGISFNKTEYNQAGALVHIYLDGSIQLNHGGTEMGQGLHSKMREVARRVLGVRRERLRMMTTSTDKVPNTSATAASSGSDLNGQALKLACETLLARLRPVAASLLGGEADAIVFEDDAVWSRADATRRLRFEEVVAAAYRQRISLSATGYYRTPGLHWDPQAGQGHPFYYFAFGAAVAEVEVDGDTGVHRLQRVDLLHDVGDPLLEAIDRGQIEGGFVQGMGWLTCEELRWNAQGKLLTDAPSTYKIPTVGEVPEDVRVALFRRPRAPTTDVIFGSKAVGEPPLMLAIAVREAIRDAVAAWRPGATRVALGAPSTPEAIWRAIEALRAEPV
jgi:xanthine dehydrogenase molybdopterin binding subunit/xanthine dehydrogenase small subunit